jgi:formylglycine-generating enzyme required for sulfatase activity
MRRIAKGTAALILSAACAAHGQFFDPPPLATRNASGSEYYMLEVPPGVAIVSDGYDGDWTWFDPQYTLTMGGWRDEGGRLRPSLRDLNISTRMAWKGAPENRWYVFMHVHDDTLNNGGTTAARWGGDMLGIQVDYQDHGRTRGDTPCYGQEWITAAGNLTCNFAYRYPERAWGPGQTSWAAYGRPPWVNSSVRVDPSDAWAADAWTSATGGDTYYEFDIALVRLLDAAGPAASEAADLDAIAGASGRGLPFNFFYEDGDPSLENDLTTRGYEASARQYFAHALLLRLGEYTPQIAPEAEAGADQSVLVGTTVQLHGGPVGLTYRWTPPAGITLSDPTVAAPTFVAPQILGSYAFTLVVSDVAGRSASDTVVVCVHAPPNLTVALPGGATMDFRWIEPGRLTMGDAEMGVTPHQVTVTQGYLLGQFELTRSQWRSVMGTTPWAAQPDTSGDALSPAVWISWDDAQLLVHALNQAAGDSVYRLPTEAEWEYACRAGTLSAWSFGDDPAVLGQYGWFSGNSGGHAQRVGMRYPNPWGLYDMHGNVWEWVQDWEGVCSGLAQVDPMGPRAGTARVRRSGGYASNASLSRSGAGHGFGGSPGRSDGSTGMRLVRLLAPRSVVWSVGLSVSTNLGESVGLRFGLADGGTAGIDTVLGERGLPLLWPNEALDARWLVPGSAGLELDYRGTEAQTTGAAWTLALRTAAPGVPVTLTWDPGWLPAEGGFRLLEQAADGATVNVDMRTQSSVALVASGPTRLQVCYTPASHVSHTYNMPAGWAMASLPVSLADSSGNAVFPGATSLFAFSGGYEESASLAAGVGYWINLPSSLQATVTGPAHPDASLLRWVPYHWSMVGPGTTALDVAALRSAYPQILSVYGYSGGYHRATIMEPAKAYWVNMSEAAEVDLSGRTAPAARGLADQVPAPAGPALWAEGVSGGQAIALGVAPEQVLELPPVPPAGLFDARVELPTGIASLQVPAGDGVWPLRLQGGVTQLRWQVPANSGWNLQIGDTVTPLTGAGQLAVSDGAAVLLRHGGAIPQVTALKGAYPNPFNPSTTIHYELAKVAAVRLQVYAVSGQLVRGVVAAHQEAGAYRVEWDGRNAAGSAVGNGVYLGVLQAGDFRAVTRMVLMK